MDTRRARSTDRSRGANAFRLASVVASLVVLATGFLTGGLLWHRMRPSAERAVTFEARPVPTSYLDRAVACLALGDDGRALDPLSEADLAAIVERLARLLHAYEAGSFDSFLALRSADLAYAEEAMAGEIETLRALCVEAGAEPPSEACGWIGALESFWNAYYLRPPLAEIVPERTRLSLGAASAGAWSPESWASAFEAFCSPGEHAATWHRPMVPHRRSVTELLEEHGAVRWIQLDLGYVSSSGGEGRLTTRFVQDATSGEWFLERAATVHEDALDTKRACLVI